MRDINGRVQTQVATMEAKYNKVMNGLEDTYTDVSKTIKDLKKTRTQNRFSLEDKHEE